jgi:hypothetical protein
MCPVKQSLDSTISFRKYIWLSRLSNYCMKFSLIYYIKNHHRIRNIYRRIKKVDIYIAENTDVYLNREYMERIHNVIEKVKY